MATETLEFEESLAPLLKEVDALSALPRTEARERELERLNQKLRHARSEIYAKLTPWQRVLVARHPSRPDMLHYVVRLFTDFVELHGDRRFADDHAIVAGTACYKGEPVMVVGHHKGGDTKAKLRNSVSASGGLSKTIRLMRLRKIPSTIVVSVDPAGSGCGNERRRAGQRLNLRGCSQGSDRRLHRRGGSGGASALRWRPVLMQEYAIYSVIRMRLAAILWRHPRRKWRRRPQSVTRRTCLEGMR